MIFTQHKNGRNVRNEYREHGEQGLSDLLNYAHFVDDGIIMNKDGAFVMSYQFRAPDINSATPAELEALSQAVNRMILTLDDGWMMHVDELRVPSTDYPDIKSSHFKNKVSELIDEERRLNYKAEGAHYENLQYISFVWKFPLPLVKTTKHWFVENLPRTEDSQNLNKLLQQFKDTVDKCLGLLSHHLKFIHLNSRALLRFLNTCITGELQPVNLPDWFENQFCFVDTLLGRKPLIGGYIPKIGKKHIYVLSIMGYVNPTTEAGLLEELSTYPLIYRWSNRFIAMSESTAESEIKRYQKHWHNKIKGLLGTIKEALFARSGQSSHLNYKLNQDAVEMVDETQGALTANSNHSTRFGYWASAIIFMHEDQNIILSAIKSTSHYLEKKGFTTHIEDVNVLDAWLGSIPAHGSANVRRLFLNSFNLSHVLPLHTLWTGNAMSSTHSLLPKDSPPVFYAKTTGHTPFRFHTDVGDVGHILIVGPTGSGKSTFLQFLMAQFLRYEGSKIFAFDNNYSNQALTVALEGHHYDIGNSNDSNDLNDSNQLGFCPLYNLETDAQKLRAGQFIEKLVLLQNIQITPDIKHAISTAINLLAENTEYIEDTECNMQNNTQSNLENVEKNKQNKKNERSRKNSKNRNLTVLRSMIQHQEVKSALQFYTLEGQFKLLDAVEDSLQDSHHQSGFLHTFEMSWLLAQKPEIYLPVLMHCFNHITEYIEKTKGRYPTLIPLEEAWKYIKHPVFAEQLLEWQKTLRKGNGRLVFITTSLSDLYDPATQSLTQLTASILESCATKIYLPNPSMEESIKLLYSKMGLNDRQIQIIKEAQPKQHYYVVTPEGNRLIELGLEKGSVALDFIGLSQEKSEDLINFINRNNRNKKSKESKENNENWFEENK